MRKNKKPQNAVWKDTNKYPFALQYQYPLSVRNRCLFFWASTLKGWKAVLNLAERLTEDNRICIVYLYGEAKRDIVERHIEKLNNPKLIVLWADYISLEDMQCVNKGIESINIIKKWGEKSKENLEMGEIFSFDYKSRIHDFFPSHMEHAKAIEKGKAANENIIRQIKEKGFLDANSSMPISAEDNTHIHDILNEIKILYQYGGESDTDVEYAYKMIHFEKWCKSGIDGDYNDLAKLGVDYKDDTAEYVQLSLFDNTSWGIKEFVRRFQEICDYEIEENGFVDLKMVFQEMQKPPFGLYKCNYYGLCVGIALRKYSKGYYKSGGLITHYTEDIPFPVEAKYIIDSFEMKHPVPSYIYMQSEEQIRLAEKILEIFPASWETNCVCLENVLTNARSWFCENVMYDTVQRTVPELFEIINLWEPCVCSKVTEKYAEWLTDERVQQIKENIKHIDEEFLNVLREKYGAEKAELYRKSQAVKGGAIGWLHSVEMVDERVDRYMKETVCRECGAVIHNYNQVCENGVQGKHARLTKKNIINLNKKLLGRYQTEFFCLRCLCEELDCTEWYLYEKMQAFKEQGCTLFQ